MTYIRDLLDATVAPRVAGELQPHLRAVYGGLVRRYLPQAWWFTTNSGSATLVVDRIGTAQTTDGLSGQPDVTITWTDQAAHDALASGGGAGGLTPPKVQVHSSKGRTAFDQLRKRLGL